MSEDCLLTKKEVAARLRVTTRTVDRYCRDGALGYYVLKAGKRFRKSDIQALLDARYFAASHDPQGSGERA